MPSLTTTSSSSSSTSAPPLQDHICSLTHTWVSALNTRTFSTLENFPYIDQTRFTGSLSSSAPEPLSYPEFVQAHRRLVSKVPEIQLNIIDLTSTIDDDKGFADTYVYVEASGQTGGIRKHGVSLIEWRRDEQGQWRCIKYRMIRGIEEIV